MSQSVVYTLHFWRTLARTQGSGQTTLLQRLTGLDVRTRR